MSFEKFYELLEPRNGQRVLVFGEALPLALYIGGRGVQEKKIISIDTVVEGTAKYKDEASAMAANKDLAETLESGVSRCSISHGDLLAFHGSVKVNGLVYISDIIESSYFEKIAQLVLPGSRIILSISKRFFNPFLLEEKTLFKKTRSLTSFRKMLMASGLTVDYYDIEGERLLCACRMGKFNRNHLGEQIPFLEPEDISNRILGWIRPMIISTAPGSKYAIREDEYLYFVEVAEVQGPNQFKFVYIDGEHTIEESSSGKGKHFNIYVLPNTRTFIEELELRDVLIVGKERILELFGEQYVPS